MSFGRSVGNIVKIVNGFRIRAPAQLSATGLPCIRPSLALGGGLRVDKRCSFGGVKVETQKSPRWRHLYCLKVSKVVLSEKIS